jgi:curved DNA-binding protein CbpA
MCPHFIIFIKKVPSNHYHTLQISASATAQEIKMAYRKLALQFHPDRNPGDVAAETKFKEIAAAYEVLSDADKKFWYDLELLNSVLTAYNAEQAVEEEPEPERPVYVRMTVENSDTPHFYWKMAGFILLTIGITVLIAGIALNALNDAKEKQNTIYIDTKDGYREIKPSDPKYESYKALIEQLSILRDSTQAVDYTKIDSLYKVLNIE